MNGQTCPECHKRTLITKEVRSGVFHVECGPCGRKHHTRHDPAAENVPGDRSRLNMRILEDCDCP
jgi:Zn ribbon nucleic-acid-binding protein